MKIKKVAARRRAISLKGLDRNFALDRKIRALKIKTKRDPVFAKFVKGEVALAMTDKLTKATAEKQGIIDTQAKRIGELSIENGDLRGKLIFSEKVVAYKEEYWKRFDSIGGNLARIIKTLGFLAGFMWASWLLVTYFR